MASIIGKNFNIDYSLVDGRVREFEINKEILYDEDTGIAQDGWETHLCQLVADLGLNVNTSRGLSAFVWKLIDEGKIKESSRGK